MVRPRVSLECPVRDDLTGVPVQPRTLHRNPGPATPDPTHPNPRTEGENRLTETPHHEDVLTSKTSSATHRKFWCLCARPPRTTRVGEGRRTLTTRGEGDECLHQGGRGTCPRTHTRVSWCSLSGPSDTPLQRHVLFPPRGPHLSVSASHPGDETPIQESRISDPHNLLSNPRSPSSTRYSTRCLSTPLLSPGQSSLSLKTFTTGGRTGPGRHVTP